MKKEKIRYRYISIEGSIGAGKTELAGRIAEELDYALILEQFAGNPFLPLFYENPAHYALHVETSFLIDRHEQLSELFPDNKPKKYVVSDYSLDKCLIFSRNNLSQKEYQLYCRLFSLLEKKLPQPDIILFLYKDAEYLLRNIQKRGREYEKNISSEYLEQIQCRYLEYFQTYQKAPVVIIESNEIDFVNNHHDFFRIKSLLHKDFTLGINRTGW